MVDKALIEHAKEKIGDATADIIADIFKLEKYDSKNKKGCCPFPSVFGSFCPSMAVSVRFRPFSQTSMQNVSTMNCTIFGGSSFILLCHPILLSFFS